MSSPASPDRPGEWAAIAVDFLEDEEVSRLSPVQVLAYLGAILHATRRLTDGRISRKAWRTILAQAGADQRAVSALERAGLITTPDENGDSVIVSYLRWNASKAYREDQRRKNRERVAAHRARQGNGERNALRNLKRGRGRVLQARQREYRDVEEPSPGPVSAASDELENVAGERGRDELVTSVGSGSVQGVTGHDSTSGGELEPMAPEVERFLEAIRRKAGELDG